MAKRIKCTFTIVVLIQFLILPLAIYGQRNALRSGEKDDIPDAKNSVKENSCVECHKKLEGALKAAVDDWEKSIHARRGKSCNICHGGNPHIDDERLSKSKKFRFIGKPGKVKVLDFCGRGDCHKTSLQQFEKGPHYTSVLKTGEPHCVSCHGDHNIQRSSKNILTDKKCSACHDIEYSKKIINSVFLIEAEIDEIDEKINLLKRKNADIKDVEDKFISIKHLFYQLVHVFSREDIEFTKKMVELEIKTLKDNLLTKISIVTRLEFLYFLSVGFSLVIIFAFAIYAIRFYGTSRK